MSYYKSLEEEDFKSRNFI